MERYSLKIIARIHTDFPEKFGVPRQSGLIPELKAKIVFEPEYRDQNAFRGLCDYSHLWLIWLFSENKRDGWSPTVRPPRLGGNERMGVFATRSPFRPNALGLSSVKLEHIETDPMLGPVLFVSGADLIDGTPIFDIKPYLPYTDSHPYAKGGFAEKVFGDILNISYDGSIDEKLPHDTLSALTSVLRSDPRPSYQHDPDRMYGFRYAGYEVSFSVSGTELTVHKIDKIIE